MPKKTAAQMRTETRIAFMKMLMQEREAAGDEALPYKGNAFSVPWVMEDGTEIYVQIAVSIPSGTRDGHQFNGHEEHENYMLEQEEKREAAAERAAEKAKENAERKAKQEAARKKREEAEAAKKAKREGGAAV